VIRSPLKRYSFRRITDSQCYLLLALVIVFGAWLRGSHIDWDGLHHTHPDERYINLVGTSIEFHDEDSRGIIDLSNLNPFVWPNNRTTVGIEIPQGESRLFAYGHFPLYITVGIAKILEYMGGYVTEQFDSEVVNHLLQVGNRLEIDQITLVSRWVSVAADCLTLVLVYLIGRKMYGGWCGLLAAGLFAVSVQFIQQARFGTFDALLATSVVVALWALIVYIESGKAKHLYFAGICIGLSVGVKATAVLLAVPALAAVVCSQILWAHDRKGIWRNIFGYWLMPIVYAALAFGISSPYAIIEWQEYVDNIILQSYMARGLLEWPFVLQYRGSVPYVYQIIEQGRWTLGWPLTVTIYCGTGFAAIKVLSEMRTKPISCREAHKLVVLSWVLSYFVLIGGLYVKYPRYMLPILPLQIVYAASLLIWIAKKNIAGGFTLIFLVLGTTGIYAVGFMDMYEKPHPWITASEWIYANADRGSNMLVEKWDHPLPLRADKYKGESLYYDSFEARTLELVDLPDTRDKLKSIMREVENGDYIILASNRNYGPVYKNLSLFPYSTRYYSSLFDGTLGYKLVFGETRYPMVAGRSLRGDPIMSLGIDFAESEIYGDVLHRSSVSDESFTVYDHPLVLIFYNESRLSFDELMDVVSQ